MLPTWTTIFWILFLCIQVDADQCLSTIDNQNIRTGGFHDEIVIQVSHNVLHQITSRILGIFLRDILNYNVIFEEITYSEDLERISEGRKLYDVLNQIIKPKRLVVNLGVWMPSDYHNLPNEIETAGRLSTGRFGWFVPKELISPDEQPPIIPYTIFKNTSDSRFDQFHFDENILSSYGNFEQYVPEHCYKERCVTLLSGHKADTKFVIGHIKEFKFYVKVIWFGDHLRTVTNSLLRHFMDSRLTERKAFIVLHWTPSEIIDADIKYEQILLPQCEQFSSAESQNELCKYELTPILKYCSEQLKRSPAYPIIPTITFERTDETQLLQMYNNLTDFQDHHEMELSDGRKSNAVKRRFVEEYPNESNWYIDKLKIFDTVACEFLKEKEIYNEWTTLFPKTKPKLYIGGIYPKKEESEEEYLGVYTAVSMSQNAIRANSSILPDVDIAVIDNNDGCHLDTVMKTFINYYVRPDGVLGVLGPPCSESVEPVAGLSKHIHMAVISYSAEGVSLQNREKYPYFFRTIGENRQYEQVYVRMLKKMNWHRIVAFTEDGQKYTEYISQLENVLKENGIELTNKKFSRDYSPVKMKGSLQDLKKKNTNIIIADLYDDQAGMVLCEAYKLQMSPKYGYVWFLPIWLHRAASNIRFKNSWNCTQEQIDEMLNGHFSISHAPYADDSSMMQTNQTVGQWKKTFHPADNASNYLANSSHYGGYAYDAVWVYALALDKLIKESPSNLAALNSPNATERYDTTKRFIQIISDTNFDGVSGRIQFGEGGTRFSTINIMQWFNMENHIIGTFVPKIIESNKTRAISGGTFNLDMKKIRWFTSNGMQPTDGTTVCSVGGFAKLLGYDCSQTLLLITSFICLLLVIMISAASFVFWKRRYDKKLKASAKLMRNFGIDLLSMSSMHPNTLDKWEISKDRVVINRRLGEGAFGTVYGGEAQIDEQGWTAVAVKTLKKGSNSEDRLDFLSEAEAMKRFDHSNIIKLLGVCLQTEPIYAVMEFMLYGDLKTFLLARRHLVNEKIAEDSDISPKRLTMMAYDVARALAYLTEMKYVHRDVACRNCLVNAQRVVKLGDFGMARSTSENDYYRFSRKGMLPVRWMAPESLSLGKFTPASDIWSFGVLLFEIITFGSFPFQGMTNNQVLDHVKEGNTLAIPNGIKPHLEGLMNACWNLSYTKRPTANEVVEFIHQHPKLVTPSLDVPLASVQIAETDSDQLELLPGLRRVDSHTRDLQNEPTYNNLTISHGITLSEFIAPSDDHMISRNQNSPITYNPIEPLLMYEDEQSSSDTTSHRYVPMNGYRNGLAISENTSPLS